MPTLLKSLLVSLALVGLAVLLNPSADKHRARIRAAESERSPVAGALGLGVLKAFVSNYHSLGVASYTESGGRVLSYGAFGVVVVVAP